ncbi:PAS domain-containing protein [Pseudomonas sp. GD03651]|uniref:hybrid sensor histidine kinase/response regulator n=1 Tax=unclassified Pseudomonas TaxID=196821 RepID=UPI002447087C|nr:PAS domain-containing sensor histidine kinase [Pseudomonas sp. GD03651]MDH2182403.1 PAS domain-containing protein [Pseudomonas sp. GD03651]
MDKDVSGQSRLPQAPEVRCVNDTFLADSPEQLRLVLEAAAVVGTWVWDIPNDRVTADERFSRSFGIPAQRCEAGIPIAEAFTSIYPEDRERVSRDIEEAVARGGTFRCEYRVRNDDGLYHWIEANGHAELDAQGQAIRFPGVLMDIEARRAAEAERDRVSALLRTFTAAVPGVVYAKDLEGRVLIANHGATQLIGKPPEFYLGKTDLEFLDDKAQARQVMQTDQEVMRGGKAVQIEERIDMPDGSATTWLSVKAPLLDEAGKVIGLIGSSIDVSARKEAEAALLHLNRTLEERVSEEVAQREAAQEALRQAQKMEAIGQLTGGIAHDFNNLLTGITGSLDLARLRGKDGRSADVERYIEIAHRAARKAAALTHRLLAFSRRQPLQSSRVDVNGLITGLQDLIRRTVGPSIDLKVDLKAEMPICLVDPVQVENSLLNLCINSRDAVGQRAGKITITTANVDLEAGADLDSELEPGSYMTISVIDNGAGMSPETLLKACEPFFTTKSIGEGTGLGLSMVYGFAKQSGGQVRICSDESVGTRVNLYLPTALGQPEPIGHTQIPCDFSTKWSDRTVLIVDDEPSVRMFASDVLSSLGCTVIEATDSQAGLQLLASDTRIDLLVTDIGLPGGIDGREMASFGRQAREDLPVIFMTGYSTPSLFDGQVVRKSSAVLIKPFEMDDLIAHVHALLKGTPPTQTLVEKD